MPSKLNALLNVVGLILVLTLNALANILPINGYNTGQISAFYPNFFVPAGFTFGIWSIIYIMLIGFVVCSIAATGKKMSDGAKQSIKIASPFFQLTCILNSAWILLWHYLYLAASLCVMILFLVVLIMLYLKIYRFKKQLTVFMRCWIHHAFVVYLAWICVATIANFTAFFVGLGWQGSPLDAKTWSIVMISIALLLGIIFVGKRKESAYGFVLSWAFFGIYASQMPVARNVGIAGAFAVSTLLALTITILIKSRKASA